MGKKFELKTMSPEEMDYSMDWAADEGWNPGINDSSSFYEIDPKGFFIGELWGRPIGCISALKYSDDYGFMGMFIVEEEFRKQWFGTYLARTALSYLGKRNIGLNGMPDRIDTYKNIGFKPAFKCIRYSTKGEGSQSKGTIDTKDANNINFEELVKYDTRMFSVNRQSFLQTWISQPDSGALCIQDKGIIKGYGVIRKCREGFKIGPLFAETEKYADQLYIALASYAPNEKIFIDIPEINKSAIDLAKRHNMMPGLITIRMYSKKDPGFPVNKVYGITSIEIG